jgi:hypothetical protein
VFGWVDLLVRVDEEGLRDASRGCESGDPACVARCAEHIRIELVDPRRGIPIVDPSDYRRLLAYVVHFEREHNAAQRRAWWKQVGAIGGSADSTRIRTTVTQVLSGTAWQEYAGDKLVEEHDIHWSGGETPVVHVQNISEPFRYEGLGEVEALIPLQDELNTRLSDRACRVTMQSFKMYLAKGIEGFEKTVVGPGQVWATDNADASVESFGGDGHSPSEDSHIAQIRDAMDKASGVPPLASGVVQGRIGNLSSANALRVTLMSVLAKTARKRVTYGRGMEAASRLVLAALHWSGALRTLDTDRGVRVQWPDPLPTDERERVLAAEGKQRLGVSQDRLLAELGYSASDPGVV